MALINKPTVVARGKYNEFSMDILELTSLLSDIEEVPAHLLNPENWRMVKAYYLSDSGQRRAIRLIKTAESLVGFFKPSHLADSDFAIESLLIRDYDFAGFIVKRSAIPSAEELDLEVVTVPDEGEEPEEPMPVLPSEPFMEAHFNATSFTGFAQKSHHGLYFQATVSGARRLYFSDGENEPVVTKAFNASSDTISWFMYCPKDKCTYFALSGETGIINKHNGVETTTIAFPEGITSMALPFVDENGDFYLRGSRTGSGNTNRIFKLNTVSGEFEPTNMDEVATISAYIVHNNIVYITRTSTNYISVHNLNTGVTTSHALTSSNGMYDRTNHAIKEAHELANGEVYLLIEFRDITSEDGVSYNICTGYFRTISTVVTQEPIAIVKTLTLSNTSVRRLAYAHGNTLYCIADVSNSRKFAKIVDGVLSTVHPSMSPKATADNLETIAVRNGVIYTVMSNLDNTVKGLYAYDINNDSVRVYEEFNGSPITAGTGYVHCADENGRVVVPLATVANNVLTLKYIDNAGELQEVPVPAGSSGIVSGTYYNFGLVYTKYHHFFLANIGGGNKVAKAFINF